MSGIYIPGAAMPEMCQECIFDVCAICELTNEKNNLVEIGKRRSDCPLIPVPDHGRLIDADAFSAKIIEIVERQKYDDFYAHGFSVGEILREVVNELKGAGLNGYANAPTIIPAEEGE